MLKIKYEIDQSAAVKAFHRFLKGKVDDPAYFCHLLSKHGGVVGGSAALWILSGCPKEWQPSDIDIYVHGDPRYVMEDMSGEKLTNSPKEVVFTHNDGCVIRELIPPCKVSALSPFVIEAFYANRESYTLVRDDAKKSQEITRTYESGEILNVREYKYKSSDVGLQVIYINPHSHEKLEDFIKTYDFDPCMCWFDGKQFHCLHPDSIMKKEGNYRLGRWGDSSREKELERVKKYESRGFKVNVIETKEFKEHFQSMK